MRTEREIRPFRVSHTQALPSRHSCLAVSPIFRAVCWEFPSEGSSLPSTCLIPVSGIVLLGRFPSVAPCPLGRVGWGTPRTRAPEGGASWSPKKPSWATICALLRSCPSVGPVCLLSSAAAFPARPREMRSESPAVPPAPDPTVGFNNTDTTTSPTRAPAGNSPSWPHKRLHC